MKSPILKRLLVIASVASGLLAAGVAPANDNINVSVTATVIGVCKFFGGPYTLNIANSGVNIDPSLAGPATGSVGVTYRCSNGTAPVFTVPANTNITDGGAGTMQATFTSVSGGNGTGMGNDLTLTINGQIVQGQYQNAPAGAYSGTINVTVTP